MKTYMTSLLSLLAVTVAPSLYAQGGAPAFDRHLYTGITMGFERDNEVSGTVQNFNLNDYEWSGGALQGSWLLGYRFSEFLSIEGRIAVWAGADVGSLPTNVEASVGAGAATSIGARLGYLTSGWLYPYLFAGHEQVWSSGLDITVDGDDTLDDSDLEYESGIVWAIGVDFLLGRRWTVRAEYFDTGNDSTEVTQDRPELSIGVIYRFRY